MTETNISKELSNQICFPFYVVSKELIKEYKENLSQLGLTYTQYITMMVLWENGPLNVKKLGSYLYLDSGTLTPLLKKLEAMDLIIRKRTKEDERNLVISLTEKGLELKEIAYRMVSEINCIPGLSKEEDEQLRRLLHKILCQIKTNE